MAKKIKSEDIVEKDVFSDTRGSAESLLRVLKDVQNELKNIAVTLKKEIAINKFANFEDVKAFNSSLEKSKVVIDELNKVEKEQATLKQKIAEATKQEAIETQKLKVQLQDQTKLNKEIAKDQLGLIGAYGRQSKQLIELRKQYKDLAVSGRENGKVARGIKEEIDKLDSTLKRVDGATGQFQRNVGNYKGELRALQKELAGLEPGSQKFNEIAQKAGSLKDKINDASDATKAFASASKFQTSKNLFGQIFSDISNFDFAGASEKSKQLASVISSISFKDAANAAKDLGSSILNLGKALILNPFVIATGAIVALGAAIYETYKSFQFANEIQKEYSETLKNNSQATKDLEADTKRLRIENDATAAGLGDKKKKQLLAEEDFKNKFIAIKQKEADEIKKLQDRIRKENEATNTETALGEGGLFGSVGSAIRQKRLERNLLAQVKISEEISKRSKAEEIALGKNYQETLRSIRLTDTKENKKELKKQVIDWEKYYNDLEQLRINNISNETERTKAQINFDTKLAIESKVKEFKINDDLIKARNSDEIKKQKILNEDIIELRKQQATKIAEIDAKAADDLFKQAVAEMESAQDKQNAILVAAAAKRKQDRIDELNKQIAFAKSLTDKTFEEINKRKQAEIKAQDDIIEKRKDSVDRQFELAKNGQANTLAFEQEQLRKAEVEKRKLAQEQEKREKRQVFFKALIANLDASKSPSDTASAIGKSIAVAALADVIAGFFATGVENFKGKGTGTSDSNIVAISSGESVLTAKGTSKYKGLATAINNLEAEKWFMKNASVVTPDNTDTSALIVASGMERLIRTVKDKETVNINWESHDTRVEKIIKDGHKKTIKYVNSKKKI